MKHSGLTKLCVLPAGATEIIPFRCDSRAGRSRGGRVFRQIINWENDHDSDYGRERKRRENSFTGSSEKRSAAPRDVPIGGGGGEGLCGNRDRGRGLREARNALSCAEQCEQRVFRQCTDSGAGPA